jgi:transposase-like protein
MSQSVSYGQMGSLQMHNDAETIECSYCSSEQVEKISSFGTAQLVRQYYCKSCKTVFEYIRWQERETEMNG